MKTNQIGLGEIMIAGIVTSREYFITMVRIRDAIRQNNPLNTALQ